MDLTPGENIEDEEEDLQCTRRIRRTDDHTQNHSSKAARIEYHDANEVNGPGDYSKSRVLLYNLSSNIHHTIFSNLENVEDVLRLSLTNRYFWAVGILHIEDHIINSLAPWAGEQIICVSDQCKPCDFPPGLVGPTEQAELRNLYEWNGLDTFPIQQPYKKQGGSPLSQNLIKCFREYEAKHRLSELDRTEILMGLRPEILEFYPRDRQWILRNLSTKEYVRGDVIALREEFTHGPQIDVLGFAEVLISRISWSSELVRIGANENLARGKWAGHRFDITPMSLHEQSTPNECWKDVSGEVFREMDVILGGEIGDDWRDRLAGQHQKATASVVLGHM